MAKYSVEKFITDSIQKFYSKLSNAVKHLDALEPELNEVTLKFFCLEVNKDEDGDDSIFVPVGTKSRPKGMRVTPLNYCVTHEIENPDHKPLIISKDDLQSFIKEHKGTDVLTENVGWQDFETMGYYIKYNDLEEYLPRISSS